MAFIKPLGIKLGLYLPRVVPRSQRRQDSILTAMVLLADTTITSAAGSALVLAAGFAMVRPESSFFV